MLYIHSIDFKKNCEYIAYTLKSQILTREKIVIVFIVGNSCLYRKSNNNNVN